jgi:hypothetical protein
MSASGYRTIMLKSATPYGAARDEQKAAAAITPGELLEFASSGNLQAHSTGGGVAVPKMVALETQHGDAQGSEQINIDYASADVVYYAIGRQGDEFYMWLAGSENASKGNVLESDGAGALQVVTPGTDDTAGSQVAIAAEDKDNSTNGSRVRIRAQII